ncbi:hypothetical protein DB30_04610 [Enhygromyxa salina]|uniref:UDP-glucose 4-epimerase n=1 Tax=Enhygromyxa salina TaxID=215803 RepID=A0A0C2DCI6_9BACT|nr:DUF779 domain-containing protein [Enhygromyxa salina]KIG19145.1 hypothetical protein DB30_04610 [Enhygromyxa salina]
MNDVDGNGVSDGASPSRVSVTPAAAVWLGRLQAEHGPLLLHQSGGCCDGSAPMCYPLGEFMIGQRDVLLGHVCGTAWYIGGKQYEPWKHTHLTLDVVEGRGSGFSLEAPSGIRFVISSRLLSEAEINELDEPARGPQTSTG